MTRQFIKEVALWGFTLWLVGYLLGIVLFFLVPHWLLGWILMPIGIVLTAWVLFKKIHSNTWRDSALIAIVWTTIAILCDYVFLVKLLNPPDGYYKVDVYLYYVLTFLLPLLAGWIKVSGRQKS